MSATVSSEGKDYQMEANETKAKQTPQLKQLPIEFVRSASCKAIETATGLASTYTPTPVAEAAMAVYERWAPTVKPYANAAIEAVYPKAETALVTVDTKVDNIVIAAKDFCSKSYDAATDRYQKLQTAVADGKTRFETYAVEYFKLVDESLQGVKGKLKEVSSLDAKEVVATKLTEMKAMLVNANQVSKDHLTHHFAQLQSAWASLLERPEVASALEYTNSSVQSLTARAELIHDAIVADPHYSGILDTASSWLIWARTTSVGATISNIATPYADALLKTKYAEAATPYANRLYEYWKPAPALEGITTK